MSLIIKATSMFSNSFLFSIYFCAFILWSFNGFNWFVISLIISSTLWILSFVIVNFFTASSFLFLYLSTLAASSNIILLSSALLDKIFPISPCEIILNDSLEAPVSVNNSNISFNLHFSLLIEYSFSPDL